MRRLLALIVLCLALPVQAQEEVFSDGFETGDTIEWSATVPPQPIDIVLEPTAATIDVSQAQLLTARVRNTDEREITWSVSGAGELVGQQGSVLFFADAPGIYTVTATSAAHPSVQESATITVRHPPRIEFVSDGSLILTGQGETAQLEVRVLGEDGQPVPGASVGWQSDDPNIATVAASGSLTATVTAASPPSGFTRILVSSADPHVEAEALVTLAQPAPATRVLPSSTVLDRPSESLLILERTAQTEALAAGDILTTGDLAGLLVRALSVDVQAAEVHVTTESVSLTEAFESLQAGNQGEVLEIRVQLVDPGVGVLTLRTPSGQLLERSILNGWECESNGGSASLGIDGASVDFDYSLSVEATLDIDFFTVELFEVKAVGGVSFSASTGRVTFDSSTAGTITCSRSVGSYQLPAIPLSVFSFALKATPSVGVEASADFDGPSFEFSGPEGGLNASVETGIRYTSGAGWQPISERSWNPSFDLFSGEVDFGAAFEASAGPFVKVDLGLLVQLGRFISIDLADVSFAEIKGKGELSAGLATPFEPLDPEYTGAQWGVDALLDGRLKAELSGGAVAELMEAVGIGTSYAGDLELFGLSTRLLGTPLVNGSFSVEGNSCPAPVDTWLVNGDTVNYVASTGGDESGTVEIVGGLESASMLESLAEGGVSQGNGEVQWSVSDESPGAWRLQDRWQVDALSETLPYTSGQEQMVEIRDGDGVPVVDNVEHQAILIGDGREYSGAILFSDSNAGLNFVDFRIVWDSCGGCAGGFAGDPGGVELSQGSIGFTQTCTASFSSFSWGAEVTIYDCQGNVSNGFSITQECVPPAIQAVDPDQAPSVGMSLAR